jgi:hypothetical protein
VRAFLIKAFVVGLIAAICGGVVGVLFSLWFYGFVPRYMLAEVYLSDTDAKMRFRFWAAFAAGAVFGAIWAYRVVRTMDFKQFESDTQRNRQGSSGPRPK